VSDFDTLQASVEASRPIELYSFAVGAAAYFFTSSEDEIVYAGDTYTAVAVSREGTAQGVDERRRPMVVSVPYDNTFAALYSRVSPSNQASLTILRLQRDETPSPVAVMIFKGFVKSVTFSDDGLLAKIAAQTRDIAGTHQIPRRTFQNPCGHQLYDANCTVDPTAHKFTGTVTAEDGETITVSGLGGSGMDFIGGYAKPQSISDFRLVQDQSGDVLTLLRPFNSTLVGQVLEVFEGCDHLLTGDCVLRFDNIVNFGGFAFVPSKDIFATGID
jgi:uncharacterized phage protein (TIGR02218 family)